MSKTREATPFRACEGLVVVARLFTRKPEDAAIGAALALGRLSRKMSPERLEQLLRLARHSYEAARA